MIAIYQISTLLARNVSRHFSAQNCFSWWTVLNKGLKVELHLLKQLESILLSYTLYVLNMDSNHLSL